MEGTTMDNLCAPARGGLPDGLDELLADFGDYLGRERSLAQATVDNYLNQARPFVAWHARHGCGPLPALTICDVERFVAWRAASYSPGSLTVTTTALRALLRWMFLDGRLEVQVAEGISPVRYPARGGVPKFLSPADLAALLAVDMSTRDRAVVLVLARLGLRSKEVAELLLDDVDWRGATLRIIGKGDDHQLMPLPDEVGEALATYLHDCRREGMAERHVFLAVIAPYRPLGRNGVSSVVTRLARRAGIVERVGAHRLRHTAATAVLAGGGSLAEASQLLRHRSHTATAVYANSRELRLVGVDRRVCC